MLLKKNPFLVSVYMNLKCVTVQYLNRRTEYQLARGISRACKAYSKRLLIVSIMYMDREFEYLIYNIPHVNINIAVASEHVP